MLKNLLARITPSCRDVTRLASESMDRMLPWSTRLSLQIHCWICEACARYRRQLLMVRDTMRRQASSSPPQESRQPSPAAMTRLKDALRAKIE